MKSSAAEGRGFHSLSQALNMGIAPLMIAFALVAISRVVAI